MIEQPIRDDLPLELRAMRDTDTAFVTNSWLKSYRGGTMVEGVPNSTYYHFHHAVVKHCIQTGAVVVACAAENPDLIFGWSCAGMLDTTLLLHYIYVKQDFRKFGLAKKLLNELIITENPQGVVCTHMMPELKTVCERNAITYNPYLLYFNLPGGHFVTA